MSKLLEDLNLAILHQRGCDRFGSRGLFSSNILLVKKTLCSTKLNQKSSTSLLSNQPSSLYFPDQGLRVLNNPKSFEIYVTFIKILKC